MWRYIVYLVGSVNGKCQPCKLCTFSYLPLVMMDGESVLISPYNSTTCGNEAKRTSTHTYLLSARTSDSNFARPRDTVLPLHSCSPHHDVDVRSPRLPHRAGLPQAHVQLLEVQHLQRFRPRLLPIDVPKPAHKHGA